MATLGLLIVFPALTAFAAVSDMLTMTIPNRVSIALIAAFVLFAFWFGMPLAEIGWHFAAGFAVLVACFFMFSAGWMGGGDAKLAAATAVWFGFGNLLDYVTVTALFGGLLTLGLLHARHVPLPAFAQNWEWSRRLHAATSGIPYGIALASAALVVFPDTAMWRYAITG
jgi:prepilin peptidase CpaA